MLEENVKAYFTKLAILKTNLTRLLSELKGEKIQLTSKEFITSLESMLEYKPKKEEVNNFSNMLEDENYVRLHLIKIALSSYIAAVKKFNSYPKDEYDYVLALSKILSASSEPE
mgnify:FL=1